MFLSWSTTHHACRHPSGSVHIAPMRLGSKGTWHNMLSHAACCAVRSKVLCLWPRYLVSYASNHETVAVSLQLGWNLRPFTLQKIGKFSFLERSNLSSSLLKNNASPLASIGLISSRLILEPRETKEDRMLLVRVSLRRLVRVPRD